MSRSSAEAAPLWGPRHYRKHTIQFSRTETSTLEPAKAGAPTGRSGSSCYSVAGSGAPWEPPGFLQGAETVLVSGRFVKLYFAAFGCVRLLCAEGRSRRVRDESPGWGGNGRLSRGRPWHGYFEAAAMTGPLSVSVKGRGF